MLSEEWRPVAGYDGLYSVSSHGRVRSERRTVVYASGKKQSVQERIMSPARKASGHLSVMLHGFARNRMHVHRLVAIAFIGEPPSRSHEVAHGDGNPAHNAVANLRWATRSENHSDKVAHGTHNRGERHPLAKLTTEQVRSIRAAHGLCKDIAAVHGCTFQTVWAIKNGLSRRFE